MGRDTALEIRGSYLAIALILIFGVISAIVKGRAARVHKQDKLWMIQRTVVAMTRQASKRE